MPVYFVIYKPYGVLSQFTRELPEHRTLADLYDFPKDVYPVGRLDKDSEGLLLLTDDKQLNYRLLNPRQGHTRTYLVQVERIPEEEALEQIRHGVTIRIKKRDYRTKPARVRRLSSPPSVPERHPPVRYRKTVSTAWLEITLTEGKNRQVRRMCAAIGYPVLRLIRSRIEDLELRNWAPGSVREIERKLLYRLLHIPL